MEILEINYVLRAKNRKRILEAIETKSKPNNYLSKELKVDIANIRKLLHELEQKGFIVCENPDDYHLKLYSISRKGRKVLKEIKKLQ